MFSLKHTFKAFRERIYQFHNQVDYGVEGIGDKHIAPDIRAMMLTRVIVSILGFVIIVGFLAAGLVSIAQYYFVVSLGSIGAVILIILYIGIEKKKPRTLGLFYLNGLVDLTLILVVGSIIGLDNPFVFALIYCYLLLIPLLMSNVMLLVTVCYICCFGLCLFHINREVFSFWERRTLGSSASLIQFLGFCFLFIFAIAMASVFGHRYRRSYSAIVQKTARLSEVNRNCQEVIEIALAISSVFTTSDFVAALSEIFGTAELFVQTSDHKIEQGAFVIEGDKGVKISVSIDCRRFQVENITSNVGGMLLTILRDKLRICQAYDQIASYADLTHNEQLKTIGLLSAGIAHEINNPLQFMAARCALADREIAKIQKGQIADALKHNVTVIRDGIVRINKIVTSMSLLGRPQSHRNIERASIESQIDAALYLLDEQIRKKGIIVRNNVDSEVARSVTQNSFSQVFLNILNNSVQAIELNGQIEIQSILDSVITLKFADNGSGMDEETLERIFDPFFTTKLDIKGTGLGMTIVKKLIEEGGGKVHVESTINKGTEVTIVIPI